MKHWYNCWLFHAWTEWSDPRKAQTRWIWESNDSWSTVFVQNRHCTVCNAGDLRIILPR